LGRDPQRFDQFFAKEMPFLAQGLPVDACSGPIAYTDPAPIEANIQLLKKALESVSVTDSFLTAVAPASAAFTGVNEYYPSEHDYIFDQQIQRVHPQVMWAKFESLVEGARLAGKTLWS
jgi:hypothetical protein